ncbi:MAG: NAD(P)-dependent oxidoreductase [Sulfobacillus thermosulfidooxidans]|nr:hypothetical protein CO251_10475 [Sulfobacillus sp. hq2]PSR32618.1 MAG: NAD(P)-dependent oxidoreductase [Sulfobacillus thermosulfidooxidans]
MSFTVALALSYFVLNVSPIKVGFLCVTIKYKCCHKGAWFVQTTVFIGLGQMGRRMVRRLDPATTIIYNRTEDVALQLHHDYGYQVSSNLAQDVAQAQCVITMLTDHHAVEDIGQQALYGHLAPGSTWVDMTTGDVASTRRYEAVCANREAHFVAAPVLGSLKPAEAGNLVVIAGGTPSAISGVMSTLERFGRVVETKRAEQAVAVKLAMNTLLGFYMDGMAEMLKITDAAQVTRSQVLDILQMSSLDAPVMHVKRPKWESGDASAEFPIRMLAKDLGLALQFAARIGVELPVLACLESVFRQDGQSERGGQDMAFVETGRGE